MDYKYKVGQKARIRRDLGCQESYKIELVKYIVSVKLAESEARVNAAEKKAQRDKIMKIVAKKKDKELEDMDVEQLMKKLEELN